VVGHDRRDYPPLDPLADRELNEAHWSYIDQAQDLLARGPLLTQEHDGHMGSIHVIAASDMTAAKQFAWNEPYCLAGLYATVEVFGFEPWFTASMWERPGRESPTSWFVRVDFGDQHPDVRAASPASIEVPDSVVCAGWFITDSRPTIAGAVLLADGSTAEITALVNDVTATLPMKPIDITIVPWRRGGRIV
jgi:uncharacterized protein YciI